MNPSATAQQSAADRLRTVRIEPAPGVWESLISARRGAQHEHAATFRAEMGLPTDRPVILSGHQADIWHPGILVKRFAAEVAAAKVGGAAGWIVVDQDSHALADIRYPVSNADVLSVRRWEALPRANVLAQAEAPLCAIPAERPAPLPAPERGVPDFVAAGLERIHRALAEHAEERSAARQVAAAALESLAPVATPLQRLYATDLARTTLFNWLLERMREDPRRCAEAYNRAVEAHPEARIAPLRLEPNVELPLWIITRGGAGPKRTRAAAATLRDAAPGTIAPRALFMTAILRLAGCDLFIHGSGGGVYDTITDDWIRDWLGLELAPTAVVTATLLLPLDARIPPPEEIDKAAWRAHHALHDPSLLGDAAAAARKTELVARIKELKKRNEDPAPVFAELQDLLRRVRHEHERDLLKLDRAAANARSLRNQAAIAHDRTWAFPLYPPEDLQRLRKEIEVRFG